MEFQNEVLRVTPDLEPHIRALITPQSGPKRGLAVILEELHDLINPTRPPRWLLLPAPGEMELLVHLATPMFATQGYDVDEYMDDLEDELVYIDHHGDAYLRSGEKEYDVENPDTAEVGAYLCANHDLLADFGWFDSPPELVVFLMIMEDAAGAYSGSLAPYRAGA